MIVMTTGLSGLMALMRQDEKSPVAVVRCAPVRPSVVSDSRKARTRQV